MVVTDTLNIPCSNLCISGDSLFYYSTEWNVNTQSNSISYGIIDVRTKEVISTNFITDGSEKDIRIPYGIMVHPYTSPTPRITYPAEPSIATIRTGYGNGAYVPGISPPIWFSFINRTAL